LCGCEDEVKGRFGEEDMFRLLDNIMVNGVRVSMRAKGYTYTSSH
jgi:hypothetical protein